MFILLAVSLLIPFSICAQGVPQDPFACLGAAEARYQMCSAGQNKMVNCLRNAIAKAIMQQPTDAHSLCVIAELMKRVGDYEAEKYYQEAIKSSQTEPTYELFYADYLRNFRGPQRPLFPYAEEHYFQSQKKLQQQYGKTFLCRFMFDTRTLPLSTFDEMDIEKLPEELRQAFTNNNISLSNNISILIKAMGHKWQVVDISNNNIMYTVKRDGNQFDVYNCATRDFLERGRIALYQQDGLSLLPKDFFDRLHVSFSSINKYARDTTDFDGVDDIRDFTSEVLFTESRIRKNRRLIKRELKGVIREKDQFETLNRLRLRYGHWPVLDVFYRHQEFDNAQITNFFEPNRFNDVYIDQYGIAIERSFNFSPHFDFFLRGTYSKVKRKGLIEFNSTKEEDIDQFETQMAFSRFFGPDRANLEFIYVFQDIDPEPPIPASSASRPKGGIKRRDRQIFAATFSYQIFRPITLRRFILVGDVYQERFQTRGIDLFGGILHDIEGFGSVNVRKNDFFIGTAFRGLGPFDITFQPTIFTSDVERDNSQANAQYRTNFSVLYRIVDEEKYPRFPPWEWEELGAYLAFWHLVVPVRHDIAIEGPEDFENFRVGISLVGKIFSTSFRGTTFLISAGYEYQRFYRLKRDLSLFNFGLSMGF